MEEKKIERYCSCFQHKTRFVRQNRLGEIMKGLSRGRICHIPPFVYFGTNFLLTLRLNVLGLFADFKSDVRLFHIIGPR